MMMTEEFSKPNEIFSCDSCLISCGRLWECHFFVYSFQTRLEIAVTISIF